MERIREVFKIAIPAVGEMCLYMLVWVIDTAFVGKYGGDTAVSAVGFSSEIMYTLSNIFVAIGISVAITTLVAQSTGAEKMEKAEEYFSHGLVIGVIIASIIAIILIAFPNKILQTAGLRDEVLDNAVIFMRIAAIGLFFNMITNMLNASLRGTGNTTVPFVISLIITIITIFLDSILIFGRLGFKPLGVKGSAIATTTAYMIGLICVVIYYIKWSEIKFKIKYVLNLKYSNLKKIISLAIPSGLQEGAFSISRLLSLYFIMHLGTKAFSANQITTTIESISFMPGWGFAVAATALVGQRIGAKDFSGAKSYAYISMFFSTGVMLICSVLFLLIPRQLMNLFINDLETIKLGSTCIMIAAIEQPFMAISMVLGGSLKGAGDTRTPFIVSLISNWCIRIPLMYYVIFVMKLSVSFVWFITGIQWCFEGIILILLFKRKSSRWRNILEEVY
ncbi:multidrug transporter MatE [Fervidicella metallireducens AeB]|uniref:Probable multidrug resistance protein NorM n=1 Tax=Fervidicella metallireducens AeB TaxID=1403537 RepID=A0A017RVQ3_9CLOT|nr:MATE family efflux transporter [Fervidicella metallireducens]EYE87975.1 multidrug transporter MatE [Fervidicella metallireducens AeB]